MVRKPILGIETIEALRRDHEQLRLEVQQLRTMLRALAAAPEGECIEIGKTDASGISTISGDTPGSGTVTLYRKPAGETDLESTGHDVICLNMAGSVAASTYVAMLRDRMGRYWAIVENCR